MQRLSEIAATGMTTDDEVHGFMSECGFLVATGQLSRAEYNDLRWVSHRVLESATRNVRPRHKS